MRTRSGSAPSGFSLIEVLTVLAIVALLTALAAPAISSIRDSMQLARAGTLVQDQLHLARQMAITRNEPVIVSLFETTDETGNAINMLTLSRIRKDGSRDLLTRASRLPLGCGVLMETAWSSVMNLPTETRSLPSGIEAECRDIRFNPSGSTALAASAKWFLTIHLRRNKEKPGANFITLAIDPVTGRIFFYQP